MPSERSLLDFEKSSFLRQNTQASGNVQTTQINRKNTEDLSEPVVVPPTNSNARLVKVSTSIKTEKPDLPVFSLLLQT